MYLLILTFFIIRDMEPMGGLDGFADTISLYSVDPVDTDSHLLQWIILYLAYFPNVQTEMQTLIDQVRVHYQH